MFDFKLQGADSIGKEYKAFNTKVYGAVHSGLVTVYSEMVKGLQKHIEDDVYKFPDFTPKAYKRRVEYGGGIPIISAKNMDFDITGMALTFSYEPSGKNSRYPTSKYVDGDALINAIENSDYTWDGTDNIPERHFWNNFVDEMVGSNGQAEKILVKGMNSAEPDLQVKADGRIEQDGNDTIFPQQLKIQGLDTSSNWDDDKLTF